MPSALTWNNHDRYLAMKRRGYQDLRIFAIQPFGAFGVITVDHCGLGGLDWLD